jgi:hypothetical protein
MKLYSTTFTYDHPWSTVTLAYFLRYPNPYATHVLASDILSRHVDEQGTLHTTRLLVKRGKLPKWGAKILNISQTYIIEHSIVNPEAMEMQTESRNLDHTRVLKVVESQRMTASAAHASQTVVETTARAYSNLFFGVSGRIEGLGVSKFRENFERSRLGMQVILDALSRRDGPTTTGLRLGARWRSVREWQARMNTSA